MKGETLRNLIEAIPSGNELAFAELYKRISPKLYRTVASICWHYRIPNSDAITKDLYQDIVIEFYEELRSGKYSLPSKIIESGIEKMIMAWLARKTQFKLLTHIKKTHNHISLSQFEMERFQIVDIDQEIHSKIPNKNVSKIESLLNQLPKRSADILRTSLMYHPFPMPSHERKRLMKEYNITEAALRQIKKRAIDKIAQSFT